MSKLAIVARSPRLVSNGQHQLAQMGNGRIFSALVNLTGAVISLNPNGRKPMSTMPRAWAAIPNRIERGAHRGTQLSHHGVILRR